MLSNERKESDCIMPCKLAHFNAQGFLYLTKRTVLLQVYRTTKRNIPMLFVRGDGVILVSPPMRSTNV